MNKKKTIRAKFRIAVFTRDDFKCLKCGTFCDNLDDLDAHHIIDRNKMPNGGYVLENGISLCSECHIKAEAQYKYIELAIPCPNYEGYLPDDLYKLIGSSEEIAVKASERLGNV